MLEVNDANMKCLSSPLPEGFSQAVDDSLDFLSPEIATVNGDNFAITKG